MSFTLLFSVATSYLINEKNMGLILGLSLRTCTIYRSPLHMRMALFPCQHTFLVENLFSSTAGKLLG